MKYDPLEYEMLLRPNYEYRSSLCWSASVGASFVLSQLSDLPSAPFYCMGIIGLAMLVRRVPMARKISALHRSLRGNDISFVEFGTLVKRAKQLRRKDPVQVWIGHGFEWEMRHMQRAHDLMKRDLSSIVPLTLEEREKTKGLRWIHGLEPNEHDVHVPTDHLVDHVGIVGTPGTGKTRLLDLLISQAVLRKEIVVIVDPKGDLELRENARRACRKAGIEHLFSWFHPAYPDKSCRLDLLRNFTRSTEIASRIASLLPSEGGNDPFQSFSWQALNNVVQGLLIIHERPTIVLLRRYLEGGVARLVIAAVKAYVEFHIERGPDLLESSGFNDTVKKARTEEAAANAMCECYKTIAQPSKPHAGLEGLISMFKHDRTHFSKMVATLLPLLNMLTSDDLAPLLSPDAGDRKDKRVIMDSKKLINMGGCLYLGLDNLTDDVVGSAIGSLYMSELTSVAGDRYNYEVNHTPVNVFIDEAERILNMPTIQLMGKGRGAGFRVTLATQTIADFISRLGSEDRALQVMGNINNWFCFRLSEPKSKQFVADNIRKTYVKSIDRGQSGSSSKAPIIHGGAVSERLSEEEVTLFPGELLGSLPNLECLAVISGGRVMKLRLPILIEGQKEKKGWFGPAKSKAKK